MSDNKSFGRQLSQNVKEKTYELGKQTLSFFGISEPDDTEVNAWNQRRLRFTLQKFGSIHTEKLGSDYTQNDMNFDNSPNSNLLTEVDDESENLDYTSVKCNTPSTPGPSNNGSRLSTHPPPTPHPGALTKLNFFQLDTVPVVRPTFRRGNTAPNMHRQISLRSTLIIPQMDLDFDGVHRRKTNAMKAIGEVLTSKTNIISSSALTPAVNNQKFNFSQQNINRIDDTTTKFSESFHANNYSMKKQIKKSKTRPFIKHNLHDNFLFRILCCIMKHDEESESVCSKINDGYLYRPYFSYWITIVQIIVFVIGCICYGFAPVGLKFTTEYRNHIMLPNQMWMGVRWLEYDNLWIGPRYADLIRMGAKYSPCMRRDVNLYKNIIQSLQTRERRTGCCIRNDGGGCYQTVKDQCSKSLSTWYSWSKQYNGSNLTGPVCGQDPKFCISPSSLAPFKWSDDITKWPICIQTARTNNVNSSTNNPHMHCEVTGRPCCVGIKGECVLTNLEHCQFMRGYFHPEALLCSQINCLGEICGMLSFNNPDQPDQTYRLITSLFLHVGIVHLLITVMFQILFLRDFEKLMGWHRTGLIYLLSGVVGNLSSAVFLPYKVEAGPSGSYFAFLSVIIIELFKSWNCIKSPIQVLLKYTIFTAFLFVLGLLPWVDNYAHLFGLISGSLLSFVFLPFLGLPNEKVSHNNKNIDRQGWNDMDDIKRVEEKKLRRTALIWRLSTLIISTLIWFSLMTLLIVFFKYRPLNNCSWCKYLTCIPLAKSFCDNMDINITVHTKHLPLY